MNDTIKYRIVMAPKSGRGKWRVSFEMEITCKMILFGPFSELSMLQYEAQRQARLLLGDEHDALKVKSVHTLEKTGWRVGLNEFPQPPRERNRSSENLYREAVVRFLLSHGWLILTTWEHVPRGYAIAARTIPDCLHCVVMLDGKLVHDPHPNKAGIPSVDEYEIVVPVAKWK